MNREEILGRLTSVRSGIEHLGGIRDAEFSDEHQRSWDWLNAEHDWLNGELGKIDAALAARSDRLDRVRALAADPANLVPGDGARSISDMDTDPIGDPASIRHGDATRRFDNPWDLRGLSSRAMLEGDERIGNELRARAAVAIERMQGTTDKRRETAQGFLDRSEDSASTIARHILLTSDPVYMRAFQKAMSGRDHLLTGEERAAVERVETFQRAMSTTGNAGGYMIPFQLDPTLILTSDGSVNPFRQLARKMVATGNKVYLVSAGNTSWSWDAEAAEVSDDTSTFAQPTIDIFTARGFVPISIEALADIPNATEQVAILLAAGKDDLEATAFATGSGSQPQGIVTALVASAGGASLVTSATADTFAVADVYAVEQAVPARYRDRASWAANWKTFDKIRQFGTADSHALFTRLQDGMPERMLGRPRYEASAMDGVINGGAENYMLVLGDFSNYVIADRLGVTVEFVPQLFGTGSGRPTGQKGWFAYYRVGADSVNDGAFRLLNVT